MTKPVIAIIGGGNMGSSLLGGLIKKGYQPEQLWVTSPEADQLDALKHEFGVNASTNNEDAASKADVIILAVKPQIIREAAEPIAATIQRSKALIMSVAAGIRECSIQQWLGGNTAIVRCMPNTPSLIGYGATGLYANNFVSNAQKELAESILSAVGITVWVDDEEQIDAVTAVSGSGPAYFFLILEAMQQAGEDIGLPADTARQLATQTALGAAKMAKESNLDISELRRRVTSPGGTTEKAVSVLENHNVRQIFNEAIRAAKQRSRELANQLGGKA